MKKTKAELQKELDGLQVELDEAEEERANWRAEANRFSDARDSLKETVAKTLEQLARLEGYIHRVHESEDRDMVINSPPVSEGERPPDYHHNMPHPIERHRDALHSMDFYERRDKKKEWWEL